MTAFLLFVSSLVALGVGPLAQRWTEKRPRVAESLDSFVVLGVLALVFGEVAPASMQWSSYGAWIALPVGLATPVLADRVLGHRRSHAVALIMGATGLILHALADGMALASVQLVGARGWGIALAVILHRIPVGLGVWMLFPCWRQRYRGVTTLVLLLIATATATGQLLANDIFAQSPQSWGIFQAFAAGMLLHVVVHTAKRRESGDRVQRQKAALGQVIAISGALGLWWAVHLLADAFMHGGEEIVHEAIAGHEHVLTLDVAWLSVSAPAALLLIAGSYFPGEAITRRKVALGVLLSVLALCVLGLWWAIGLTLLFGIGLFYQSLPRNRDETPAAIDAKFWADTALRDFLLGSWSAAWLLTLVDYHGSAQDLDWAIQLTGALVCLLLLRTLRPSLFLVVLPALAGLVCFPPMISGLVLGEGIVRAMVPSGSTRISWLGATFGCIAGILLGHSGWNLSAIDWLRPDATIAAVGIFVVVAALVLACTRQGVRSFVAGSGEAAAHHHSHSKPAEHEHSEL